MMVILMINMMILMVYMMINSDGAGFEDDDTVEM